MRLSPKTWLVRPFDSNLVSVIVGAMALGGCASGPPRSALENKVFYQYDDLVAGNAAEQPYPPLDQKAQPGLPECVGVSILEGTVRFSRPANWKIRRLSMSPKRRFVEYVSPSEYVFAIYERTDSTGDSWREVQGRYEVDVKEAGAELLGGGVPVATANAQGRAYVVRRKIKAQRSPYVNMSREVLLRNDARVDLVTIVHQGETLAAVSDELLRVMETLELL